MSKTQLQLVQELSRRMGELITFTGTTLGTATTIISTGLDQYIPEATAKMAAYVYALSGTGVSLQEVRAKSYAPTLNTLTLHDPGFTAVTPSGATYELHRRTSRSRKLEALNSGIRQLGLYWPRRITDTSITTAANTRTYTLPAAQNWVSVDRVDYDADVDSVTGYPYLPGRGLNWEVITTVTTAGVETVVLQLAEQPPIGRTLRVHGWAKFSELALDADVLPTSGQWEGKTIEWLLDWAKFRLLEETVEMQPGGQAERYRLRAMDKLQQQKEDVLMWLRPRGSIPISTPHSGTGQPRGGFNLDEFNIFGLYSEFAP